MPLADTSGAVACRLPRSREHSFALDADDFERVEACLHPDVTYRINGTTQRGPGEVVASYRAGSALARRIFDHVGFGHEIIGFVDGDTIRVDFSDRLEANGESFEHHSVQDITVGTSGTILAIGDRPVDGQQTRRSLDSKTGRGQVHGWFLVRFTGDDSDIDVRDDGGEF